MGILAGDEECYTVFAELFDKVIEEYHNGFKTTGKNRIHNNNYYCRAHVMRDISRRVSLYTIWPFYESLDIIMPQFIIYIP